MNRLSDIFFAIISGKQETKNVLMLRDIESLSFNLFHFVRKRLNQNADYIIL